MRIAPAERAGEHRRARTATILVAAVAVVSVVSWRRDAIYDGDLDPVVIAKGVLAVLALSAAALVRRTSATRYSIGLRTAFLLAIILAISLVGAYAEGGLSTSAVVVIRVILLAGTVLLLCSAAPWRDVLAGLLVGCGGVAVVAAATGAPGLLAGGRLEGGIPDLAPNELAGLAVTPLVALICMIIRDGLRWYLWVPAATLALIVWTTGSRSALAALAVSILIALVASSRRHRSAVIAGLVSIPLLYVVVAYTNVLTDVALRGQSAADIATLSARTDAWSVVFGWPLWSWERWIGVGLAVKQVAVNLKWREFQVLDSSWISALAQTGLVGTAALGVLLAMTIVAVLRRRADRWLAAPLLGMLLVRAFTENGLIDASAAFLLLFTLAVGTERRTRRLEPPEWVPRRGSALSTGTGLRDNMAYPISSS